MSDLCRDILAVVRTSSEFGIDLQMTEALVLFVFGGWLALRVARWFILRAIILLIDFAVAAVHALWWAMRTVGLLPQGGSDGFDDPERMRG
jgi:hypothetical protein